MKRPRNKAHSGFTILEMIISLALIGMLIGISSQLVRRPGGRIEIESSMRGLCRSLRASHALSMARNNEIIFRIDYNKHSYFSDGIQERFLSKDIIINAITSRYGPQNETLNTITFFPDGSSSGGDIFLALGSYKAKISVNWLTSEVSCSLG